MARPPDPAELDKSLR